MKAVKVGWLSKVPDNGNSRHTTALEGSGSVYGITM